jgi:enoyl-CoA hydratase
MSDPANVHVEPQPPVWVITIDRPHRRNAVDAVTAAELAAAFAAFEDDADAAAAVLTGAAGVFSAGFDLVSLGAGEPRPITSDGHGPMGPTRMRLGKPVIAAVEGYAVAGGFELALWCDLRVAGRSAVFGIYNRRWGIPLVDLGTIRLPRLIGHSHAMDLILTGRGVSGDEALRMGLANRLVDDGAALDTAVELAHQLARVPQPGLRNDRLSAIEQWDLPEQDAWGNELRRGLQTIADEDIVARAAAFARGSGRHGAPADE